MAMYCCNQLVCRIYMMCIMCSVLVVNVYGNLNRTESKNQTRKPISILEHISGKSNTFGFDVYRRLPESVKKDDNVLISPLSLFATFSQICLGARGSTEDEMAKALYWLNDDYQFLYFMRPWLQSMSFNNEEIQLANKLWVSDGVQLVSEYKQNVRNHFGTEIGQMNVAIGGAASEKINKWVQENTNNKIQNLIPADAINSMTRLVLTNAVYFKGEWAQQFQVEKTKPGVFCLPTSSDRCSYNAQYTTAQPENEHQVSVHYMNQRGSFPYAMVRFGGQTCQLLRLPYTESRGQKFSMLFLLPPAVSSTLKVESILRWDVLDKWMKQLRERTVDVTIPKMNLTYKLDVNGNLVNMKQLFTRGQANLSGMNGKQDLYVAKAVHKVTLAVDEQGSEAAAATGVVIQTRMGNPEFVANRPFFFFIVHEPSNAIVFSGKINNPKKQ